MTVHIRDHNFRVVRSANTEAELKAMLQEYPLIVQRIDVWARSGQSYHPAQLGIGWDDGATSISDWIDVYQLKQWLTQTWPTIQPQLKMR